MSDHITKKDILDTINSLDNQTKSDNHKIITCINDELVEITPKELQKHLNQIKLNDTNTDTKSASDSDK